MLSFVNVLLSQLDSPDFTVDKSVTAYPGCRPPAEAAVSVCFEPHQLGEVQGLLSLSSDVGGHYTFVLHGTCTPPQAQGPFTIKPGRTLNIPFKNVFLHATTYSFQVRGGQTACLQVHNSVCVFRMSCLSECECDRRGVAGPAGRVEG